MNIVLNVWIENKEEGSGTSCDVDLEFEKVEPPISKFKIWMREEFILNIYKNDEWAPLWAAEDKAQRVHAMMVYWYKLQWHLNVAYRGVKIEDFWLKTGET